MHIIGIILVGFIAGLLARILTPGPTNPRGFILTTVLGVVGAIVATWLGQEMGFYAQGEKAGFIGAVLGAVVVLLGWRFYVRSTAL
jgi:uncharacterized membrane protein YeaQ/YmgE (transglycosylase-associated protein family)